MSQATHKHRRARMQNYFVPVDGENARFAINADTLIYANVSAAPADIVASNKGTWKRLLNCGRNSSGRLSNNAVLHNAKPFVHLDDVDWAGHVVGADVFSNQCHITSFAQVHWHAVEQRVE